MTTTHLTFEAKRTRLIPLTLYKRIDLRISLHDVREARTYTWWQALRVGGFPLSVFEVVLKDGSRFRFETYWHARRWSERINASLDRLPDQLG